MSHLRRYWPHIKFWLWKIFTMGLLGFIYVNVIGEGLRLLVPPLGLRLSKVPFLAFLDDYEATYRLDLAMFFALLLLIAVWWLWDRVIMVLLGKTIDVDDFDPIMYRKLVLTLGVVILGADATLFYMAMTESSWGGSKFSFSALLATIAYIAVLLFVSMVSTILRAQIHDSSNVKGEFDETDRNPGSLGIRPSGLPAA